MDVSSAVVASVASLCSTACFFAFVLIWTGGSTLLDGVMSLVPVVGAVGFGGITFQLTVNSPERQRLRGAARKISGELG